MKTKVLAIGVFLISALSVNAALIGYWNMNETDGSILDVSNVSTAVNFDTLSGSGTLSYGTASVGAGTYGNIVIDATTAAAFGTAISSAGNAKMTASMGSEKLYGLSNNFTVMGWLNTSTTGGYHRFLGANLGDANGAWAFGQVGDQIGFTRGGIQDQNSQGGLLPGANEWVHYAITVTDSGNYYYVNGVLKQSNTGINASNLKTDRTNAFNIFGIDSQYFIGALDEVRVYDEVLTEQGIVAAASSPSSIPEPSTYAFFGAISGLALVALRRRKKPSH
jgi:hypothetical protein